MHEVPTILGLMILVTILALVAPWLRIPVPTCMVLGGLLISLLPGLPVVQLPPDLVFLVFLPPLLYSAAWTLPWHQFKRNLRPILLLAIGLVLATAIGVAVTMKWIVPEMSWAIAFALGGILGPPDAVAATSVTRGLGVPSRTLIILEGESLVNDATGLVIFRLGIAAALTGSFAMIDAVQLFLLAVLGGVAIGYALGFVVSWCHRLLDEKTIETVLTLLTPYAAYLLAEFVHVSGVLATVTAGIYLSRRQLDHFSPAMRLQAMGVWQTLEFILNGLAFVLIGLQLPTILKQLSVNSYLIVTVSATVAVYLTVVVVRFFWVFPAAWLPRALSSRLRERDPMPPLASLVLIGWCGMRGVVSLAAALSIPEKGSDGLPFPFRDMLIAITFGVVLGTLVIQGISLSTVVRWLGLGFREQPPEEEEAHVQLELVAAAISYLESRVDLNAEHPEVLRRVRDHFERQGELALSQLAMMHMSKDEALAMSRPSRELYLGAVRAQRRLLHRLRDSNRIESQQWQNLVSVLDLEETRCRVALGVIHKRDS